MQSKSPINETVIANALVAIFERLTDIEKSLASLAQDQVRGSAPGVLLKDKLGRLTLKRHAVLTATLGQQSYQTIASLMQCSQTTVKLHLKATLEELGIRSREILLASHRDILSDISDAEYQRQYGLSKTWWTTQSPELMTVLQKTKPAINQHAKPSKPRSKREQGRNRPM